MIYIYIYIHEVFIYFFFQMFLYHIQLWIFMLAVIHPHPCGLLARQCVNLSFWFLLFVEWTMHIIWWCFGIYLWSQWFLLRLHYNRWMILTFFLSSPTFRKIFPEYVEKYEEQQVSYQSVIEHPSRVLTAQERSKPLSEKIDNPIQDKKNKVEAPIWMLLLLVSVVGIVMALPLLQLW